MRNQNGSTLFGFVFVILWLVGIIGWIWNLVKLVHVGFSANAGDHVFEIVIRIIGVVTGVVGAIIGYF